MLISLFQIFKVFFITGIQLIGGGYVILPLLKKYTVNDNEWITEEELIEYFSLSQCVPGLIAINTSIFIGYKLRKIYGAIVALFGIVLPSFLIILILANILIYLSEYEIMQNILWGVRIGVLVLLVSAIKEIWTYSMTRRFSYMLFALIMVSVLICNISPVQILIISALIGLLHNERKTENV